MRKWRFSISVMRVSFLLLGKERNDVLSVTVLTFGSGRREDFKQFVVVHYYCGIFCYLGSDYRVLDPWKCCGGHCEHL